MLTVFALLMQSFAISFAASQQSQDIVLIFDDEYVTQGSNVSYEVMQDGPDVLYFPQDIDFSPNSTRGYIVVVWELKPKFLDMASQERHTLFMNTNYKFGNSLCEKISPKQRIFNWAPPIMDYKEDPHQIIVMAFRTNNEVDGIGAIADTTFIRSNLKVIQDAFAAQLQSISPVALIGFTMYRTCELGDTLCQQCQQVPDGNPTANPPIPWTKCNATSGLAGVCKKNGDKFECNTNGNNDCTQDTQRGLPCACNLPPYTGKNGYCADLRAQCKVGADICRTVTCVPDAITSGLPCACTIPIGQFGLCKFGVAECWLGGTAKCNRRRFYF